MKTKNILSTAITCLLALTLRTTAADVTSTWTSATNGLWNVNTNWSNVPVEGGFPNDGSGGFTYNAVIGATGSAYVVTLNTTDTVENLLISSANATLTITAGTFTANTGINLTAGSLLLNGGTISNTAITAAAGTLNIASNSANLLTGVTINGDLNLNVTSAVTKIAGGTTFATAHLAANSVSLGMAPGQTLAGTISFEGAVAGTRHVEMNGTSGTFTVGATGIIQTTAGLTGDGDIGSGVFYGGVMTLANQGLISSQVSGRTITIAASSLSNTGTLSASNGGILTINSANWSNAGSLNATGSTVNLNGAWSNLGGTMTADATSTLNFGGTFSTPNLGTLTLATGSKVNITGAWTNTGQTFTLNSATGSWTLNGGSLNGGTLGFANGQTLIIASNSANLLSGVTVNGDLNLNVTSAVTRIAGGTTFATAHLAANSVSLGMAPGQTLAGTISFEGAVTGVRHVEMNGTSGTFTVGATGIIQTTAGLTGDGDIGSAVFYGGLMTLANQGLISSQVSGRTITISASSLSNTGTLSASSGGILTINSTNWSNAGSLNATGSTVNLNGAWSNLGGTMTADATSTLNFGGTFSTPNLGTLTLATGSKVNITGAWTNTGQTFTLNSATGSWTLNGGSLNGGTLGFANGQTLIIASNSANLLSGVTVNGDLNLNVTSAVTRIAGGTTFATAHLAANSVSLGMAPGQTLAGTISFEGAVTGVRHVEMNGTSGTFTVGATGIIQTTAGLTGDGDIGSAVFYGGLMTLANQGLISSQVSGRTITISASSLSNTGTLSASSGGILTINSTNWSNAGSLNATGSTVNLNGAWSNLGGTMTADATSTLNFGGTFSTPNLGTLTLATGSKVNITGAWTNTGQTFTLNSATGSWTLNGGSLNGGTLGFANGQTLIIASNSANLLSGVTVNGDLNLNVTSAATKIAGGTTFATAHLAANATSLGMVPGQTLTGTVSFEGAVTGVRYVEMNGTAGTFTVGPTGIIQTTAGLTGDGNVGGTQNYGGVMTLANQGLISSQVSGRTITIAASSLNNTGTLSASSGGILTIAPTNSWTNAGTISLNAGTVNLGGTFNTTGGIGTWSNTGGTVNITGTILNTADTITLNSSTGSWTLNGGTINGGTLGFANGQNLIVASAGANLLTGVTVNGDLTLNVTSAATKIGGGTTFATAHLAANATSLGMVPGQTLTGTVSFEGAVAGTRYVEMNGTAGAFTVGPTGIIQTTAGLTGDGNIGGTQNYGGAMTLTNQGQILSQVSGRTITIPAASLNNTGTLSASNGGILTINSANWTNAGTISLNAGTVNLGGTFNTTGGIGTWSNTGGTVNITGTILNTGSTITLNSSTGSWMLDGGTINGGTLGFANGQNLNIAALTANLLTGVTVNGDLTLNVTSAATKIAAGTTFNTAHLAANATSLGMVPGQTLTGIVSFEGAVAGTRYVEMNGTAGAFTVGPTGIIQTTAGLTGDGNIGGTQNYGGAMTLTNQGQILSQVSGRTITIPAASLNNTGTLSASNGGILTINSANWTNAGTISLNAGTVNLGGTFNTTGGIGTWSNTGGTVNITGTILNTGSTITLNSSTGSWMLDGGTINGGTLGFASGRTLNIAAVTANLLTGVTVNGDLTLNVTSAATKIAGATTFTTAHLAANASSLGFATGQTLTGTVSFEGAVAGVRYVEMNGTAGTFTVGPTGIIQTTAGLTGDGNVGGTQNYGGAMTLANQGLISSQVSGRTITIAAASLSNTGTLSASNGGILTITGTFTNNAAGILTGGTYLSLASGSSTTLTATGSAITQIAANTTVELSGTGSIFQVGSTHLETSLTTNNGTLMVLGNRSYTNTNALANGATPSNSALFQLGGGTFIAPGLINQSGSTILGFGTINPRPTNHGLIESNGGTLAFASGILGGSGTVQIDPGSTLDLSAGASGSNADFLIHNGTAPGSLNLGTNSFTVAVDYNNANFGTGNAFNNHANVTGTGQILAANPAALTTTGALAFGNVHVGDTATLSYTVNNNMTSGSSPQVRTALQTAANGGNITDARLSGAGVTASNLAPIVAGASSSSLGVTFTASSAGALTGQQIHVASNFDNVAGVNVAISSAAYRYANPTAHTPEPVNFGNFHVGDTAPTQLLSITNNVPADGFSEKLDASIGAATGGVTTNSGSFSLLAPTATDGSSLSVGISTAAAGSKNGTATIVLTSDGTGTSGLANTTLASQTVNVTGAVFRLASPTAHTPEPVNFGNYHVGDTAPTQLLSISNGATADGFSEKLDATIGTPTGGVTTNSGTFSLLAAGAANNSSLSVGISTASAGSKNGTATISLTSDGTGTSGLANTTLASQTVNVTGAVFRLASPTAHTPEPVNFGNYHVGDTAPTQLLSISNGATADGFSEKLDATIGTPTGGVTTNSGTFSLLAAGAANNSSLSVGISTASAGSKNGTATISLTSDGTGTSGLANTTLTPQTVNVTGSVFRLASPTAHTPEPVAFGNFHVGDTAPTQLLSLSNGATADGFSEKLDASIGAATGGVTTNSGTFSLLAAGATDNSSLIIGISTAAAGSKNGTATISLTSDGTGTSGLASTPLTSQTVNVTGSVFRLASPTAHTPEPVVFGNFHVGDTAPSQLLSLTNGATVDGFSEKLDATIGTATGGVTTNSGTFSLLAAGATNNTSLSIGISTASAGSKNGTATISLTSDGTGTSGLTSTPLASQTVNVTGSVYRLASPTAHTPDPVAFGNFHVGDAAPTQLLSITNNVPADGFSEKLDAAIGAPTGGVTTNSGTFTLLAAGATNNASLSVGISTAAAGNKSGTATIALTSDGTGTSGLASTTLTSQTVNVTGSVFRLASPTAHTPEPVAFGNFHVGDTAPSQLLSLTNGATVDGFSEKLDASIGTPTGGVTTNSGTFSLLAAGATNNTSLIVGISTAVAGSKSGTATIALTSDGTGTSGLASTTLTSQTVNVTGSVFRLASPTAHTPEPVAFGNFHVGDTAPSQLLSITNGATADGFSEKLDATIGAPTGGVTTNSGSFSLLAPTATDGSSLSVGISTASAGSKNGTATISLTSDGTGTSGLASTTLTPQTVNVTGSVFRLASPTAHTPEPVNFGIVHVGDSVSQTVSITNGAAADGFSEKLDASIGTPTGGVTTNSGTVSLLAAGATNNSNLSVGISASSAGTKNGTAIIALISNGTGTSGLASTPLTSQTVNVQGQVNFLADPRFTLTLGTGTLTKNNATTYTLDFGQVNQNSGTLSATLGLLNFLHDPTFQDQLSGTFNTSTVANFGLTGFSAFSGTASGNSYSTGLSFDTSKADGVYTDSLTLNPSSDNASGSTPESAIQLNIEADIVPEPGSILLLTIGGSLLFGSRQRRRIPA